MLKDRLRNASIMNYVTDRALDKDASGTRVSRFDRETIPLSHTVSIMYPLGYSLCPDNDTVFNLCKLYHLF